MSAAQQHLKALGSGFPVSHWPLCQNSEPHCRSPVHSESHLEGRIGLHSSSFNKHQPLGKCKFSGLLYAVQGMALLQHRQAPGRQAGITGQAQGIAGPSAAQMMDFFPGNICECFFLSLLCCLVAGAYSNPANAAAHSSSPLLFSAVLCLWHSWAFIKSLWILKQSLRILWRKNSLGWKEDGFAVHLQGLEFLVLYENGTDIFTYLLEFFWGAVTKLNFFPYAPKCSIYHTFKKNGFF